MPGKQYIFLLMLMLSISSCKKDTGLSGNGGHMKEQGLPAPPEEVNHSNVFIVDFFSTLEDDGDFFEKRDISMASRHIREQSGKRPLIYMFDRADFTVGNSHPLNRMSYDIGIFQFFAQHQTTGASLIQGTGIATYYPISKYDGFAGGGTFMSGCTIQVPLTTVTQIVFYTTKIETVSQLEEIGQAKSVVLSGDAVIIGSVKNDVKPEVLDHIEKKMSLRAFSYGSDNTVTDLLVVVPASYVCRSVESGSTANLPYYRISIEKWM